MDNNGDIEVIDESQRSNLNISDVLEAITNADPSFGGVELVEEEMSERAAPAPPRPYVRIVEQPASKALRFRYECEGRSAGSIPGANSTPQEKTFPTIEICGHSGKAVVVVSCVTKDKPYRPHPHNLVGRELCKKGVCTVNVSGDSSRVSFSNLGIQCVKKRDIEDALRTREEMRVDPFKTGFAHKNQPQNIDLNAVRLCFQVFLSDERTGKIRHALPPVVSDVIYDKKAMSDLVITRLSHCSASVLGGQQVILLCEKVAREDIAVSLFEQRGGVDTWRADAADVYVHKQVAICFSTPRYDDVNVQDSVQVYIQLRRPSDNATSEALPFELIPAHYTESVMAKRKKPLTDFSRYVQPVEQDIHQQIPEYYQIMALQRAQQQQNELNPVKLEPTERTSPHLYPSPHLDTTHPVDSTYGQWPVDNMHGGGLVMAGPSYRELYPPHWGHQSPNLQAISPHMQQSISPNMQQSMSPNVGQTMSPNLQAMSPNMQAMSPNMQAMSPNMQAMSPNMQAMSPNMQAMSPNMQAMSPMGQSISPNMGHVSPNLNQMSPAVGHVSPAMGHVSPAMGHVSPHLQQQPMAHIPQDSIMDTTCSDPPSLTKILQYGGDDMNNMNSTELCQLSGLSSLLGDTDRTNEI